MSVEDKASFRCAFYARISTDKQRKESIDDQFAVCEAVAKREGFTVVARFSDKAISAGTAERAGYQAMLTAARDHKFDFIISEDISRLWRNRAEFGPRSAELEDLGIHWVSCVGDDTRREGWGMSYRSNKPWQSTRAAKRPTVSAAGSLERLRRGSTPAAEPSGMARAEWIAMATRRG